MEEVIIKMPIQIEEFLRIFLKAGIIDKWEKIGEETYKITFTPPEI